MDYLIMILRYVAPVAAILILATCIISLFRNRPRVHKLARLIDQNDGNIVEITHWETSIGKSKANDIVLPLPTVARFHAVIAKKRKDWVVTDTSARAIGILVNGEKVDGSCVIENNDIITIGNIPLKFECEEALSSNSKKQIRNEAQPSGEKSKTVAYGVLVDIKTNAGEFIIPYAEFPEKLQATDQRQQITNGQVYKISDFMKEMNLIFDEKYLQDHPEEVIGMNYRRDTMAKKKWVIAGIFGIVVLFFVANTQTMKGFCYTVSYPGGEMIFMKNGKCYVGIPGSEKRSKLTGRSYDGRPTSLSDTDEVEDTYSAFLGTFVSVDKGRWIGVHCVNRYFLIQCSGYDKPDKKKFDSYQYIFGKPYFVFKNNGKKDDYPQEFLEKSKESNLGLPVQK